jgi:2-polyprenyl-3-methyl-5-hydroxy-6-metoxy-1,4-benzoquinol methylase
MAELLSFPLLPTFRDPAGSVELRPDGAYRRIRAPFDEEILAFLALPIASRLVAQGRLVASEILPQAATAAHRRAVNQPVVADQSPETAAEPGTLVLRHPRVSFTSYPWEWSPALWLAAAELTLGLSSDLVREGWQLKDATPLNVLFEGTQPVFVDVLSIERARPGETIWLAYGQFIRTFLLPMLAYARLGWPLDAVLTRRDGYEPEEIYAALGWPARLSRQALTGVTLPVLLSGRGSSAAVSTTRTMKDPEFAREVMLKMLDGLRRKMLRVVPKQRSSAWTAYAETATHYSDDDHSRKRAFVTQALTAAKPARVLDVGCNSGAYSRLASETGAEVVSIDTDLETVDRLATSLQGSGRKILPLHLDLARPTPATGWENRETASFLGRATGHFDTVMMLAVIHHLVLSSQIPLERISALCANLTTRNLIVEWVPPTDVKFRELVRGREALCGHITEIAFRDAFQRHFTIARECRLANGRVLVHLRKR